MTAELTFSNLLSELFWGLNFFQFLIGATILVALFYFLATQEVHKTEFDSFKDRDERILWTGRPGFLHYMITTIPHFIFGLTWASVLISAFHDFKIEPFSLASLFLLLLGLPSIAFFYKCLERAASYPRVHYALSNKRLLTSSGWMKTRIDSVGFSNIEKIVTFSDPLSQLFHTAHLVAITKNSDEKIKRSFVGLWGIVDCEDVCFRLRSLAPNAKQANYLKSS